MGSLVLTGDTSGSVTIDVPAVAGSNTVTIPAVTGTAVIAGQNSAITSGTAVASTSGTSIDFTGIPSWVKRITVMLNGVSTNGSSAQFTLLIGSGSLATTGYASQAWTDSTGTGVLSTAFLLTNVYGTSTNTLSGTIVLTLINSNTWVENGVLGYANVASAGWTSTGNSPALGGALDRIRITTFAGTETFDAGTINILYE
jgi:hypothetical protein